MVDPGSKLNLKLLDIKQRLQRRTGRLNISPGFPQSASRT